MKKFAFTLIAASLPFAVEAAPVSYTMDPFHTFVNFEVDHLGGLTRLRGRFDKTAGKFTIDPVAKTGSVEVTVQTASVTTGDNERGNRPRARDEHLRSPDFFNVAEFPTLGFRSTKVVFSGDNPTTIDGNATLLGVTRPLSFKVERWKCIPHPQSKREICGGNLSATMKRSDFGMKFGIPSVGDELQLFVMVEGLRD
jgi:polyisoprenoid-binding protein YceI